MPQDKEAPLEIMGNLLIGQAWNPAPPMRTEANITVCHKPGKQPGKDGVNMRIDRRIQDPLYGENKTKN